MTAVWSHLLAWLVGHGVLHSVAQQIQGAANRVRHWVLGGQAEPPGGEAHSQPSAPSLESWQTLLSKTTGRGGLTEADVGLTRAENQSRRCPTRTLEDRPSLADGSQSVHRCISEEWTMQIIQRPRAVGEGRRKYFD
jgi:hypothetical protein